MGNDNIQASTTDCNCSTSDRVSNHVKWL